MQTVVTLKLLPTAEQDALLSAQLTASNRAASAVSQFAYDHQVFSYLALRKLVYPSLTAQGFKSQAAQHIVKKVADAYKTLKSNLRNGNYGKKGSARYEKMKNRVPQFRDTAAQPFDARNLSWDVPGSRVAVTLQHARIKAIDYVGRESDLELLRQCRIGECDLFKTRQGKWMLTCTITRETPPVTPSTKMIGVDLGIVQIASIADDQGGQTRDWSGGAVTERRKKNVRLRNRLQKKGTRSAKRVLKKRSGKEARYAKDINHQISKQIIEQAQRTGHGVAIEKLTGIRDRVRLRKPQRSMVHSWAFAQLAAMIVYKGALAGVQVVVVDPRYTSQMCSSCGVVDKKSRVDQSQYRCRSCGVALNADTNAAINIARKGLAQIVVGVQSTTQT